MNTPANIFLYELKRRLRPREILLFLAFAAVFIFIAAIGKAGYQDALENRRTFRETEQRFVKSYIHYTQYGTYGLRLLFIPPPPSILYNDTVFQGLQANVNSGDRLSIYKNLKGRDFFGRKSGFLGLLGFSLLAAALFAVLYGCDLPRRRAYLRFLANFTGTGKLFVSLVAARLIILLAAYWALMLAPLVWLRCCGIDLFQPPLLYVFLLAALLIVFFFSLGAVIGTCRGKTARVLALGCFYVLSFVLLPLGVDIHTRVKTADMESQFSLELENLELIMKVERRLYEKFGNFKSGDKVSPVLMNEIKQSLDREFKVLFDREKAARALLAGRIRARHRISALFPVLFYNRCIEELSGCGGKSYLDFYRFCSTRKKEFIYFYVRKKFTENAGPGKVQNFVTGEENLFYAGSRLPYGFRSGIILTLLYLLTGLAIAYYRFRRILERAQDKQAALDGGIDFHRGQAIYLKAPDKSFVEYLRAGLNGNRALPGWVIRIDGKPVTPKSKAGDDCAYICSPGEIPGDITVSSLFRLLRGMIKPDAGEAEQLAAELQQRGWKNRFCRLDPEEKARVLFELALLKQVTIYIFNELLDQCSPDVTLEMMTKLERRLAAGSLVIYTSSFSYPNIHLRVDQYVLITKRGNRYESKEIPG